MNTVLSVDGMTCHSCIRHVESALRDLEGVRGVEVRLREGKAIVEHEGAEPSVAAMVEALREAGYAAAPDASAEPAAPALSAAGAEGKRGCCSSDRLQKQA
ncbi:MAG: heavy metal-associated domain-containing protein [Byssovorax sp.]